MVCQTLIQSGFSIQLMYSGVYHIHRQWLAKLASTLIGDVDDIKGVSPQREEVLLERVHGV